MSLFAETEQFVVSLETVLEALEDTSPRLTTAILEMVQQGNASQTGETAQSIDAPLSNFERTLLFQIILSILANELGSNFDSSKLSTDGASIWANPFNRKTLVVTFAKMEDDGLDFPIL